MHNHNQRDTMKVLAITQARIGSSRLPGKVLLPLGTGSLLDVQLARLARAQQLDRLLVATTQEAGSEQICAIAAAHGCDCYQGSLTDVLDRFYQAAKPYAPQWVVRLTSDCPLLDPALVDAVVAAAVAGGYDYYTNTFVEHYPDGQDVEVFRFAALERAWQDARLPSEREHVTPYLRKHSNYLGGSLFTAANHPAPADYGGLRMTVDEPADLAVMRWLVDALGEEAGWQTYADYMRSQREQLHNAGIVRNEGYAKSINQDNETPTI